MPEMLSRLFLFFWLLLITSLTICAFPAWGDDRVQITLDLSHYSGDITEQQRADLLASSDWEISGIYTPSILIPGITAHWETCGLLWSTSCLIGDRKKVYVAPAEIKREGTQMKFSLPMRSSTMFKIDAVSIRSPLYKVSKVEIWVNLTDEGVAASPVFLQGDTFLLAGTLTMQGRLFNAPFSCPDKHCWGSSNKGQQYTFKPTHRFAYYDDSNIYYKRNIKAVNLPKQLPEELHDKEVYHALMYTMQVDSYRIDYVDIAARDNKRCHSYGAHEYHILYVDGIPIKYASMIPDADASLCKDNRVEMAWGNDGNVISAIGKHFEETKHDNEVPVDVYRQPREFTIDNGYSAGRYLDWNTTCAGGVVGSDQACKTTAPTPEQIRQIQSDAQRVRGWFITIANPTK